MDNKKLMQILLRDISELQELISIIRNTGRIDPFEAELLYTRISGVRHMLEVVSESGDMYKKAESERAVTEIKADILPDKKDDKLETAAPRETETSRVIEPADRQPGSSGNATEPVREEKKEAPVISGKLTDSEPEKVIRIVEEKALHVEEKVVVQPETPVTSGEKAGLRDEMELEEEDIVAGKQTLGERFTFGKSVNDLLLEQGRPDSKFSNMPVTSLQSAIGINDRFLFTRELFEGNAEIFSETIRKIDAMSNLHDAAVYLRENFKWKKNDTSLKFIDLIKRRFI